MRLQAAMAFVAVVVALCAVPPTAASPVCGARCKVCEPPLQQYVDGSAALCAECEDGYLTAANGLCGEINLMSCDGLAAPFLIRRPKERAKKRAAIGCAALHLQVARPPAVFRSGRSRNINQ